MSTLTCTTIPTVLVLQEPAQLTVDACADPGVTFSRGAGLRLAA